MSVEINALKESLTDLVDLADLIARHALKENGLKSEDCQVLGITNALSEAQMYINGIELEDIRYSSRNDIPEESSEKDWSDESIIFSQQGFSNVLEQMKRDVERIFITLGASVSNEG